MHIRLRPSPAINSAFSATWIVVGYLIGAVFSHHIYMDMARTHWSNLWVYFWMFFWPFGLAYIVLYYLMFVVLVVFLGVLAAGLVFNAGPLARSGWR